MSIDKTYDPAAVEAKLYGLWEKSGAFACDVKSAAEPFCIMMPPPNVTGSLHMGHALTFTLQDILTRYRRMQGRDALWQPGTDHAGIATQMVVERELAAQGKNMGRREMGREAFLKKVWEWKEQSGGTITKQLRRLGASCDWARERFTMDPALSKAVTRAFVTLYREKLIYKDKRLVNWDPRMLTAVSDLEVEQKEIRGNLWHFKYPIEGSEEFIIVATTRPETMLGDTGIAVHPENERLKHLIGKFAVLPLVGRRIPIIGDEYADPEKGTGAVKMTPAHDFNDFEVGKRHQLPMINIFDQYAQIIAWEEPTDCTKWKDNKYGWSYPYAVTKYSGVDRFKARKNIVEEMESIGLVDKIEPHTHVVPHGDRSGVPIEPWLSDQWYCKAEVLAQEAIKAVKDGRTKFVPQQWENTYFSWMENIEPWCISRQLWWGHQIPAWYGLSIQSGAISLGRFSSDPYRRIDQHETFVAENEQSAAEQAKIYYEKSSSELQNLEIIFVSNEKQALDLIDEQRQSGKEADKFPRKIGIWRDEDVLDTWFSSALWPFSTLGWPEQTPELKRYYPTDVLVTGFDIIFFWVARMMMMGLHFMKDVPFETVYIHALVRDEKGQKMSKTKGNVIDPLDVIDKYGCDALRFTLAHMSTPGRDIKLAQGRIEGNRNFATKLWNAARYCQMNECVWKPDFDPASVQQTVNKWIVAHTKYATRYLEKQLNEYRFDLAALQIYTFIWNEFCDWYLEFTKPILSGPDEVAKTETRTTTAWVLEQILRLLHPFMPYITEELWGQIIDNNKMLISEKWPQWSEWPEDRDAWEEIGLVTMLISTTRNMRAELNVPAAAQIPLLLKDVLPKDKDKLDRNQSLVLRLARASAIKYVVEIPKGSVQVPIVISPPNVIILGIHLADVIDLDQERARLKKESEKWAAEIKKVEAKLGNKDFVERAPPEVIEEHRERKSEAEAMLAKLQAAQQSLAG